MNIFVKVQFSECSVQAGCQIVYEINHLHVTIYLPMHLRFAKLPSLMLRQQKNIQPGVSGVSSLTYLPNAIELQRQLAAYFSACSNLGCLFDLTHV